MSSLVAIFILQKTSVKDRNQRSKSLSKPLFLLVAGTNGSGKSTFTKTLKRYYLTPRVIDPDAIAKEFTGSASTINQAKAKAGRIAIERIREYIAFGSSFIAESTISGHTYLRYINEAKAAGFHVVLVYMGLETAEISAKRVASRVLKGGHDIPLEDIHRRQPKSLANLIHYIEIVDVAHVYDNSTERQWVAGYRDGKLVKRSQHIPKWLARRLKIDE